MSLTVRGISYVTGETSAEVLRGDLRAIREDLHCTAVMLIGTDAGPQLRAARIALDLGLDVYVRPHLADRSRSALLAHLAAMAAGAEELRRQCSGRVTLLVGSEFSLTQRGMLPGRWVFLRLQVLVRWRRFFDRRITRKLRGLLADALATARGAFHGPVTYAAGYWERVDWSGFDIVGVNLYRLGDDPAAYERRLDSLLAEAGEAGKPVVITEFGCGAFRGAERRGPGSFLIVNWLRIPPRVREGHERDERTQAAYLGELIDLFADRGVHGCFVYTFVMRDFPHHEDPARDLDMAGFGVVRVSAEDSSRWQPKAAYAAVADRYADGGTAARS
ncbi:hypothetical protein B0I33_103231 [Prauserella shujinwangii]|uniref:Abortive infection protein n=1 Tax=Prauserella shujinwangii TaxID=1453103 RepID=A0A2T0LYK3_9PSEU|nr:hypothetical protein [Prauserella shujinwangii]PRX49198.1 hypothetical protein B0I33_103231 [Prauserella shujinwangii]